MHARVVTVQIQPGKTAEAVSIYNDSVIPAAKEQRGFRSANLLTDPNGNKGVSVVLWDTEADMLASESSGYFQEQLAKFGGVFAASPVTEHYEVSAHG